MPRQRHGCTLFNKDYQRFLVNLYIALEQQLKEAKRRHSGN